MSHTTVTVMRYISANSSLRIPKVYVAEGNLEKSEIGVAYMLLEPLEGFSYVDMLGPSDLSSQQNAYHFHRRYHHDSTEPPQVSYQWLVI